MSEEDKREIKEQILKSATELFIDKGYAGVKMQTLADLAGVNKGLLHYYFKGKKNIFFSVIEQFIGSVFIQIETELQTEMSVRDHIQAIVSIYYTRLKSNPKVPLFIIQEFLRNPELAHNFPLKEEAIKTKESLQSLFESENYDMSDSNIINLMMSLLSLSVFPRIMAITLSSVEPNHNIDLEAILEQRISLVTDMLMLQLETYRRDS